MKISLIKGIQKCTKNKDGIHYNKLAYKTKSSIPTDFSVYKKPPNKK